MASNIPSLECSKILLGELDISVLSVASNLGLSSGVLVNPGLTFLGATIPTGVDLAGVNIGPPAAVTGAQFSLNVQGNSNFLGIINTEGVINDIAFSNIFGTTNRTGVKFAAAANFDTGSCFVSAVHSKTGPDFSRAFTNGVINTTDQFIGDITGTRGINAQTAAAIAQAAASPPKGFDMHHPTKPGWRLTHICIEGPEAAVYYRGKLEGSNIIELPDYWRGLVNAETITAHLTPIGSYQELYYELSDWGTKIKVLNNASGPINCSYVVFGERKDVDKIIVEYEGKIEDYPGRDQRSIVGYHYDHREGIN